MMLKSEYLSLWKSDERAEDQREEDTKGWEPWSYRFGARDDATRPYRSRRKRRINGCNGQGRVGQAGKPNGSRVISEDRVDVFLKETVSRWPRLADRIYVRGMYLQ